MGDKCAEPTKPLIAIKSTGDNTPIGSYALNRG